MIAAAGGEATPPLPRGLTVLLTLAAGVIVVGGIRVFSGTVGPIILALIVVVVVSPVQGALTRRGLPAWVGTATLMIAAFGVLAAIFGSLVWAATELVQLFNGDTYSGEIQDAKSDIAELIADLGVSGSELESVTDIIDLSSVAGHLTAALSGALGVLSSLSLLLFTLFFAVLDSGKFTRNLDYVATSRANVVHALRHFATTTRSYFVVSSIFGLIVAVFDVAILLALGIPLALVWGLLSFITNYIPNVGFIIGLVPPAILAFLEGGWTLSLLVVALYAVVNTIIQSVIQPKFVGDAVGLSVTLTFVSLIFWGWVLGPLGALLAVPLTLLAKALLIDIDPTTRWAAPLIALDLPPAEAGPGPAPPLDPEEQPPAGPA